MSARFLELETSSFPSTMLTYEQARRTVIEQVEKARGPRATVNISVWDALGFVLADEIKADREYPPFHRSTRDGYAVRAMEVSLGATLRCVAEIKAGDTVMLPLARGTCVQIMTGAAVPDGADAVVMIEHTNRDGDSVRFERAANRGKNICRAAAKPTAARRCCLRACTWATRSSPWLRKSAQRNSAAPTSRTSPFSPPAMKWLQSIKRPARFRFATATAFPLPRKCASRAASPFCWAMPPIASTISARKSPAACEKTCSFFPAACQWGSTTWLKRC